MKKKITIALLMGIDVVLINLGIIFAFYIRFDGQMTGLIVEEFLDVYFNNAVTLTIIKVSLLYLSGLYKNLWKYASIQEAFQIVTATFIANTAVVSYMVIMQYRLPRSIYILSFLLDVILIGTIRFGYRLFANAKDHSLVVRKGNAKRIMVIGAGQAGALVIKELKNHESLNSKAVAVIDDDDSKFGNKINGVPILGDRYHIRRIVERKKIDEIIIAIPSAPRKVVREIVEECSKTKCSLKIVPGIYELIDGNVSIKQIRDVDIEDLLGREPIKVDLDEISDYITDKVVLVTGGGGSIGSELCRQISNFNPKKLLILDIYENNAYDIQNELIKKFPELKLDVIIASIRDRQRIEEIFKVHKPEVIFHAAAHKHVPLMENNPHEAIKNNVFGTLNVAECAHHYGSKRFVLISTDKAVNPTNVMGATKRVAEMIVQSLNKVSKTEFVAVRFGNVLGSNGSVIPLFRKQIKEGGPVTVTHSEVTRYFMTIPEAVQLVIQAGAMAKGGEIFVLDMGEPIKIIDLARNLVRLSGFEPDEDIEVKVVGLRPGEKLFEELLLEEEGLLSTKHDKIFVGNPIFTDLKLLRRELEILQTLLTNDGNEIKEYMTRMVPTYEKSV